MRWPWVFSIAMASSAIAQARPEPPARTPATGADFWKEMIEPHAEEVGVIVGKARELMMRPDHALNGDTDWAVDQRAKFYRDARNMLAYARKLSPQNVEVLGLLGRAADELGDTRAAIEALEACAKVAGDKVPVDVAGRLGAIRIRLGELDAALKWLRLAQGQLSIVTAPSIVNLANVLAAKGDSARAIDTLLGAIPPSSMLGGYTNDVTVASFALAVLYDRDEQPAAAFAVLDQMQNGMTQQYASNVQNELVKLRLPAPEDLHYYRGLLYESLGQYVEARAEWAHYVAAGDTPWRARALDHITAIDAQRRAKPGAPPLPQSLNPAVPNPRHLRRHP